MTTFLDLLIIAFLSGLFYAVITYLFLGNRLLTVVDKRLQQTYNLLRSKSANAVKTDKAKGSNSGNMLTDIMGMIPPEVIGGLIQKFLVPKNKTRPPSGGVPPHI